MTKFEALFGIKESKIKKTCVLMPLVRNDILKWLSAGKLSKGKLYSTADADSFTLIRTGIGPALLGDSVLYLKETRCKNIILFGSCGLVGEKKGLGIGDIVAPERCYSMESFTEMLLGKKRNERPFHGDRLLLKNFTNINRKYNIKKVTCATLGSLKLEEGYVNKFKEKKIQIVDMECSAFFCASEYIKRKAMALFYITDIINKKPFYRGLDARDKSTLFNSIKSATDILCNFIEENLND
jgi:purine-nucleoside phosphorylase